MPLRIQIISVFLAIMFITITVASLFHYRSARSAHLQGVYNHMESISEAKKNRMIGLIRKRQEQIILLQLRELIRDNFVQYQQTGNRNQKLSLIRSLEIARDRVPSFRNISLVSLQGRVQVSSSPNLDGADFSGRESFRHALKGELCMHEFFYDESNILNINLAGLLVLEGNNIGVIVVETNAEDILSIINDYTGLGETGETTLAKRWGDKIFYLTPTRFNPAANDSLIVNRVQSLAMTYALSGNEAMLTNATDYRDERVIAAPRYLPVTGWGLVTKIDYDEVMLPLNVFLRQTILLGLLLFIAVAIAAHFFAQRLIRPVVSLAEASREIANGNLTKRIHYNSKNEVGRLAQSFNIMADKLVEKNEELSRKIEELDHYNDSLNRFAYIVSHDLKSPLHSITALLDLLKENYQNNDERDTEKMLHLAEGKAKHMQDLINGILQYSMSGMTLEEQEEVSVKKLLEDLVEQLDVPEHISISIGEMPVVRIERVLLLQIFQNLLSNSIKYMDKLVGYVEVGYKQHDGAHMFSVKDNGRGIEQRYYEKIFDIFNKTHQLPGIDSTGLGLSIVKKIVEGKGGKVWLESEVGTGTTFYFTLPMNQEA